MTQDVPTGVKVFGAVFANAAEGKAISAVANATVSATNFPMNFINTPRVLWLGASQEN